MSAQSLDGTYRLVGVHDLASAFLFTPDGHFQYFYIYGVADRNATGTYTIEKDTVKLKSDKEPGKDFPITNQAKKGKGFTIQVKAENPYLLRNILAIYFIGEEQHVAESDDQGIIHMEENKIDKIYLQHQIFPDIPTLIKDEKNDNNYFEVSLSPSLGQVSFKGIDFPIDGDTLTCLPNYFLPFDNIRFVKE
ncbi:MAG TPA: hypothetical protein VJ508_14170 [Saprospiraceae bacterium]|nr:hypothetical protein [Saprospiraceae bacterium]